MIIVTFGLPGTGKSFFARHLAEAIQADHLKSDTLRAELEKMGRYDKDSKDQVYETMMHKVANAVESGKDVIADATFHKSGNRKLITAKARELDVPLYFIRLIADEAIIRERVSKNRPDSEADFKVYKILKAEMDPVEEECLELDSGKLSIETMLEKALEYIGLNQSSKSSSNG